MRVNRNDFMNALDEVHPAFGVSEEELMAVVPNGIIKYDSIIEVSDKRSVAIFHQLLNVSFAENTP